MTHKLLLADDSLTIQRVVELTFAEEDVEVTAVGDGQLAIDRLEGDPPDIVLADVDMPRRDGYEVAAYVRSHPSLAHIPVVLLTSAFEAVDEARAAEVGSADVFSKPFEPQMVISRVKELLARKRRREAPPLDVPLHDVAPPPIDLPPIEQVEHLPTAGTQPPAEGGQTMSLDDYFDQLDAAFSKLDTTKPARNGQQGGLGVAADPTLAGAAVPLDDLWERLGMGEPAKVEVPRPAVAVAEPPAPPVVLLEKPTITTMAAPPPSTEAPVAPRVTANPFASLSAAKEEAAARSATPVITDEVIEEVVSRVLQRLGDTAVQKAVTEIVSQTAERLVQEEIERIKNSGTAP